MTEHYGTICIRECCESHKFPCGYNFPGSGMKFQKEETSESRKAENFKTEIFKRSKIERLKFGNFKLPNDWKSHETSKNRNEW